MRLKRLTIHPKFGHLHQRGCQAIMGREFNAGYNLMEQKEINMRTAAYPLTLNRIGEAIASQGTVRNFTGGEV